MNARRWKLATLFSLLAFALLLAYLLGVQKAGQSFAPDSVVVQVQKLSELVTVRYRIQRVVTMTEETEPMGAESILLMVEGEVRAGIDLHKVSAADVTGDGAGGSIVTIPAAVIFDATLDETKTKVWDRHVTWWTPWVASDPDLEHKARLKAVEDVRQAATGMGILIQAQKNAQDVLQDLFGALGWRVRVKVRGLD